MLLGFWIHFFATRKSLHLTCTISLPVYKKHHSSYNICFGIERCRKHSSFQEYHRCTYIIHLHSPTTIQKYRQLANRGWPLDPNNTSHISYTVQCRELVRHSFDSFWTTVTNMYHEGPSDGIVSRYVFRLEIYGQLCILNTILEELFFFGKFCSNLRKIVWKFFRKFDIWKKKFVPILFEKIYVGRHMLMPVNKIVKEIKNSDRFWKIFQNFWKDRHFGKIFSQIWENLGENF